MHDQNIPSEIATIFDRFGGVRPMAKVLDEPASTIMAWKRKGAIPRWRIQAVIDAARKHGIEISVDEPVFARKLDAVA